MTTYYIAETDANGHVNDPRAWTKTNAQTLAAAKRAAERCRMFVATAVWVGEACDDGTIRAVAVKRRDPISGKPRGWVSEF
jgi:hypothetical protein